MPKNVSEETQKEAKHTEGAELKQRRWHYVFSFLSSQKKQNQTKTDYLKVSYISITFMTWASELFNHFDMYLFAQTFTSTFQVPVCITATVTTCTPMTAYFWFGCNRYSLKSGLQLS